MKLVLFSTSLALLFGCFNKQDHQITAPKMPNYIISGKIVDEDDNTLQLSQVAVNLQAAIQLYDCEEKVFNDTTDEEGSFQFSAACPGFYNINLKINNVLVKKQRFELKHADTTLYIFMPKLLYAELIHSENKLTGLFWRTSDSLRFLSTWVPLNSDKEFNRIFAGTIFTGFRVIAPWPLVTEYPELSGLVQFDTLFYTFGGGLAGPTIYKIGAATGKILGSFKAPHRLTDITFDNDYFWGASTRQSFIQWQLADSNIVNEFISPGNHPRGIAWDKNNIWSSDEGEFEIPRLYKHNSNMDVILTYCPVYMQEEQTPHILLPEYLTFSPDGSLWCIAPTRDGSKGIYKITLD